MDWSWTRLTDRFCDPKKRGQSLPSHTSSKHLKLRLREGLCPPVSSSITFTPVPLSSRCAQGKTQPKAADFLVFRNVKDQNEDFMKNWENKNVQKFMFDTGMKDDEKLPRHLSPPLHLPSAGRPSGPPGAAAAASHNSLLLLLLSSSLSPFPWERRRSVERVQSDRVCFREKEQG